MGVTLLSCEPKCINFSIYIFQERLLQFWWYIFEFTYPRNHSHLHTPAHPRQQPHKNKGVIYLFIFGTRLTHDSAFAKFVHDYEYFADCSLSLVNALIYSCQRKRNSQTLQDACTSIPYRLISASTPPHWYFLCSRPSPCRYT